jgi:4-hydroxybenzoate polyprenyltransferase
MLGPLLQALRPHQWVKNLLVFAPLMFTDRVAELAAWTEALLAFAAFCMCSSSVYLLNDLVDREEDRRHPKKKLRPIASGALPVRTAVGALAGLLLGAAALSVTFGFAQRPPFAIWPAAYLALNLAYSFRLKRVVVIDCMCIALGFQLRVHAGAAAIHVATSHWILLCTFFFSLFLAFCKRYEELSRQSEATGQTRATMKDYTPAFLNMLIGPLAALSILSYALYTVSPETVAQHGTDNLMYTVPIVAYGVFRYLFLVYRRQEGGDPARLLFKDFPLLASGVMYVGVVYLVLQVW